MSHCHIGVIVQAAFAGLWRHQYVTPLLPTHGLGKGQPAAELFGLFSVVAEHVLNDQSESILKRLKPGLNQANSCSAEVIMMGFK